MRAHELKAATGRFAVIDYGGSGPPALLIHGTGQNAEAWSSCAAELAKDLRVVAFDMRCHGQTLETSSTAEQYWRDLDPLAEALGWKRRS
ncbi:MAG TPA: alpha/beta hydrolase [Phenylobacterium sp.]|nr:alpha/beta hydrolase [Phenylobacterium sp.]